jgi:hypothetical protein
MPARTAVTAAHRMFGLKPWFAPRGVEPAPLRRANHQTQTTPSVRPRQDQTTPRTCAQTATMARNRLIDASARASSATARTMMSLPSYRTKREHSSYIVPSQMDGQFQLWRMWLTVMIELWTLLRSKRSETNGQSLRPRRGHLPSFLFLPLEPASGLPRFGGAELSRHYENGCHFAQDKLQVALANPANPGSALLTKSDGRRLQDQQRQCLVSKFKDINKDFLAIIITAFPNEEAQKYATEISTLFLRMGYQSGVLQGTPKSYDDTGLIIGLKDPDHPSDPAKKFSEFVGSCLQLHERSLRWDPPPNLLPQFTSIDFDLFVGPND